MGTKAPGRLSYGSAHSNPSWRSPPREISRSIGISARQLAEVLGVPGNRIRDIGRERRGVTSDTAIRLGRTFKTNARIWLNLQQAYELSKAEADFSGVPTRAA
jgi:antitoxin HigA-1